MAPYKKANTTLQLTCKLTQKGYSGIGPPTVYRPHNANLQQKSRKAGPPPVYRPQPPEMSPNQNVATRQNASADKIALPKILKNGAPPVYRPHTAKNFQRKPDALSAPPVYLPKPPVLTAPPVYRPTTQNKLQPQPSNLIIPAAPIAKRQSSVRPSAGQNPLLVSRIVQRAESHTVGAIFAEVEEALDYEIGKMAGKHKAAPQSVWNLIADLDGPDIEFARLVDRKTLPSYLKNPVAYTSCVNSAKKLFSLISSVPLAPTGAGNYGNFATVVEGQDGKSAVIYAQIGGASHGFVIVVNGDKAEILQSFAGESGATLSSSFEGGSERRVFDLPHLVGLLRTMNKNSSQTALFGGNVEYNQGLTWQVAAPKPGEEIREAITNKALGGLGKLK